MALQIMGGAASQSKASMWVQVYEVVKCNWDAYVYDQGHDTPLVSARFYSNKWCKAMGEEQIQIMLDEVNLYFLSLR